MGANYYCDPGEVSRGGRYDRDGSAAAASGRWTDRCCRFLGGQSDLDRKEPWSEIASRPFHSGHPELTRCTSDGLADSDRDGFPVVVVVSFLFSSRQGHNCETLVAAVA